ncbi:hypothetical protein Goari_016525 [Gossypium aridum]|uniref:Uncharacterized protein n=1 Tax=Gossypium aridum TaxID=34290 RepID=A0A7J8WIT9_GOSAI|nr:hypothetical protein [Gossypium aridum]
MQFMLSNGAVMIQQDRGTWQAFLGMLNRVMF